MDNKYKIYLLFLLFLCSSVVNLVNSGIAYCENSIATFKDVADEAEQLRNQYKERQDYLQEKQYLEDLKSSISSINEALKNNIREEADVSRKINELWLRQRENRSWFVQNRGLVDFRVPLLQTMSERSECIEYLDKEIANCEAFIAEREQQVEYYNQQIEIFQSEIVGGEENNDYGSASFEKEKQAVLKALDYVKYDENRLEEADIIKYKLLKGENAASEIDREQIIRHNEELWNKIDFCQSKADKHNEVLQEHYLLQRDLYLIRERVEAEYDLRQELEDLRSWKKELEKYNNELKNEIKESEAEQQRIEQYLSHKRYGRYLSKGVEYYSWRAEDGSDGHQLYMSADYFQEHGYSEYGLSFSYVNTSATYGAVGEKLNGLTDASVHYGVKNANDRYTVKYTVDIDVPIGDSRTGSIPLSDDLVPVTRLSEGLNVRPGIEVTRRDGDENIWHAAVGYNIKGGYNYSKENSEASVNPGDAIEGKLSWSHAEKNYQLRLAVETFFNSKTKEDNLSYREGTEVLYKAMYNRRLSEASELMGYYWLRSNGANKYYDSSFAGGGSSSNVRYYGLEYKYFVNENRSWFIRNNNMLSTGNYYDPISNENIDGREKHTLGIGYEINMQEQGTLTIDANYYWLRDKNPYKKYKGMELAVWFTRNI